MRLVPRLLLLAACIGFGFAKPDLPGRAIYLKQCAACHGADGQGAKGEHNEPLFGDRSIASLARLIERTMPEDEPEACVGDEAALVADYIYNAFYSQDARERLGLTKPPRLSLSRLTVEQHRNSIADLLAHFTPKVGAGRDEPGWLAEYFVSKGMSKAHKRIHERIDPQIAFDFGTNRPAADVGAEQFAIVWSGSFLARDTGIYEFRTRTENGVRLYLNSDPKPRDSALRDDSSTIRQSAVIDDWVSSGPEHRTSSVRAFLLGGRRYPISLDYFKYKEKHASVRLEWKPPHGTWSVLDASHVRSSRAPRTFAVPTSFPADDRSHGYERGISISKQWHTAVVQAAVETSEEVADRLPLLSRMPKGDPDWRMKLTQFCREFGSYAFRRPFSDGDVAFYIEPAFAGQDEPEAAVKRALILILSAPPFLYPEAADKAPAFDTASRLASLLWDSVPDGPLWGTAQSGALNEVGVQRGQAQRMLGDERTRAKMRGFFSHWLEMEERDLAKDKMLYPEFDEAVIADLRYSLEAFVESILWGDQPDYRRLLHDDGLILNGRLQNLYGPDKVDPATPFTRVTNVSGQRSGVLTHPYLLSAFAYHNNTSPIHRGVFLTRNIIGRGLKQPPTAVAFKDAEFDPTLTMREKVTSLTRDAACMSCHSVVNPLGFALENYDTVGRWRTTDKDKPINTTSEYTTLAGEQVTLKSAKDIARFASASLPAQRAFVAQLFEHLAKQPPAAYGRDTSETLRAGFAKSGFDMRKLMVEIALTAAAPTP